MISVSDAGAQARARMVMALRAVGIEDERLLRVFESVPRDRFVPATFQNQAWEDTALPIGLGQTISHPQVVAEMTQALNLNDRSKVLEIGTGSGYQTAILARLARRVYSLEVHKALSQQAEKILAEMRLSNVALRVGDGGKGWPEQAPFDRIIATCAVSGAEPPPELLAQLGDGGIMVIPLTLEDRQQWLVRFERMGDRVRHDVLSPVRFVPFV